MSSRSKAAGTRWETAVAGYLRQWWPDIERRSLAGRYDRGDLKSGPTGWTIECKNEQRICLPLYLRQAKAEAANNGDPWYVVVVRNRRGQQSSGATGEAFAVLPLEAWANLVRERELAQKIIQGDLRQLSEAA